MDDKKNGFQNIQGEEQNRKKIRSEERMKITDSARLVYYISFSLCINTMIRHTLIYTERSLGRKYCM